MKSDDQLFMLSLRVLLKGPGGAALAAPAGKTGP